MDTRTRRLLEGPIAPTLLALAAPNVVMLVAQVAISVLEAYFVGWLGAEALAGVSVTFPLVMLMQTMSAGGRGGGVASAVARALGAGRGPQASRLVAHAIVIALAMAAVFTAVALAGGPAIYRAMGARAGALDAALAYSNVIFAGAAAVWLFNTLASVVRGGGNMLLTERLNSMVSFEKPVSSVMNDAVKNPKAANRAAGTIGSASVNAQAMSQPKNVPRPRVT